MRDALVKPEEHPSSHSSHFGLQRMPEWEGTMIKSLQQVLAGREGNYLLPFFWQHGAEEAVLREMMAKIRASAIREVCVESRPHPDFCGPRWFHDMDIILDEAQKRGMRVWVLDDKQFPTGFAGGLIEKKYPEHSRLMLDCMVIDAYGPDPHASFLPGSLLRPDDKLVAVVASRRVDPGADFSDARLDLTGDLIDLTGQVTNGRLFWPIPDGLWSLVVIYATHRCQSVGNLFLLNPISPAAVDVLIESSYEPHYRRYGHLFGKTFAGFFSDEPQFANTFYTDKALVGRYDMQLPWSGELNVALEERFGPDLHRYLPCLWFTAGEHSKEMRYSYMDALSCLYNRHFNQRLTDWCHAHHVAYIGHVVEDLNQHARLSAGVGHYFRALGAQDMAGVDIVMHQIHPGFDQTTNRWHGANKILDGEFFHYGLIKMASSLGHLDPKKKGRTLCENFGAYGWVEGIRLMKWLVDHCVVRGVNYFTPHAFTDSRFPEVDGPPHFYAHGQNPQYRFMSQLFRYTNRLCHLFTQGRHVATALVLYHADAEWWGEAMLMQKPMRELMQRQIDLDVAPCDVFRSDIRTADGCLLLNEESYRCLVVPQAEALPGYFLDAVRQLHQAGVPVYFIGGYPSFTCEGSAVQSPEELGVPIELADLADHLLKNGWADISVSPLCRRLRIYHYQRDSADLYLFFNEEPEKTIKFTAKLPAAVNLAAFDAMNNKMLAIPHDQNQVMLTLEPYQSIVLVASPDSIAADDAWPDLSDLKPVALAGPWTISLATSAEYPRFTPYKATAPAGDINGPDELPDFSGTIRYECRFSFPPTDAKVLIQLKAIYEVAEVWLNGHKAGCCISNPYVLDLTKLIRTGDNQLIIDVTNTLAKQVPDFCSAIVKQSPGGMLQNPILLVSDQIGQFM